MLLRLLFVLSVSLFCVACSSTSEIKSDPSYPKGDTLKRREKMGTLSNNDKGFVVLGGDSADSASSEDNGIGINAYLWKATLDTLSFMPLSSADPFGGVIITDWYEIADKPKQRFKVNAFIKSKSLVANGIKVVVFSQNWDKKTKSWVDQPANDVMGLQMEDAVLTRARELKVADERRP